ncbi:AhpC/TSA family protein [Myxococcota bacterium]|nr:AhpC/TSA family protein [Myxococcota bacterium]
MRDVLPEIRRRGAELVVVGNGPVHFAKAFRDELGLDFPLFTDPSLATHAVMGLRRDVLSTFGPASLGHAVRALRKGFRQEKTMGDPWQQGGVFVLVPPDTERFAYVSTAAGDHAKVADVLAALPR